MKKNLKKCIALGLTFVMMGLCACGKSDNNSEKETDSNTVNEETNGIVSVKRDIDYGKKNEPRSFEGSEAAESELYVKPIEGVTDEFIRGVDISSYIVEKDSGVVYKDFEGNELSDAEFFNFLADCGVNWVRVRVWNNPYNDEGQGYGGGNNDIDKAVAIGKLATNAGMRVLIDFHYSDFWADPSKQMCPKDWAHKTLADKAKLLSEFTTESLNKLLDAGVDVGMVQIGNETNAGMAGETDADRVYTLMKAGCEAVRGVSPDIKIAVHYANPENGGFSDIPGTLIEAGVDFDVFGVSYYPYWHSTVEKLKTTLQAIVDKYDKEVMIAETSYVYTFEDGDGFSNSIGDGTGGIDLPYEISVQGQANEVRDVMEAVHSVGDKGIGLFYWEPAWLPVQVCDQNSENSGTIYEENKKIWEEQGSGWASSYSSKYDPNDAGKWYGGASWDNQAMFAFDGTPLESLNVYKYIFGGTTAANVISNVPDMEYESGIGNKLEMPATISAIMLDGSKKAIPVVWNADEVAAAEKAGAGEYAIKGVATSDGKDYDVICNLAIKNVNYIKNGGIEEADMSMWSISDPMIDRVEDNNKHEGSYSLKFYSESAVKYTVEQKLENIPAGTYELSAFLQGGDAGSSAIFELYIKVNGQEMKASTGVTSWQQWDNPTIKDIVIPAGAEVIVGIRADAAAKAWGAWDDFTLYQVN